LEGWWCLKMSQDLRECSQHLSDIMDFVTIEEVMQNIFVHFCIGKYCF
jgi:tRNA modification GTPase